MEICYAKNDPRLRRLLQSAFFHQLAVLLDVPQAPTLRQLKTAFKGNIDHDLDYLIKKNIVTRKDRRYYLSLPIESYCKEKEVIAPWTRKLWEFLQKKSLKEKQVILMSLCQSGPTTDYAFEHDHPYAYAYQIENEKLLVFSLSQAKWPQALPAYFAYLQTPEDEPYETMVSLLGDVNVDYYLDQIWMVFSKLKKGKRQKETIFLKSLSFFDLVKIADLTIKDCLITEDDLVTDSFLDDFQLLTDFQRRSILGALLYRAQLPSFTLVRIKESLE